MIAPDLGYYWKSPFTRCATKNASGIATAKARISQIDENQFPTDVATSAKL